MIVFVRWYTRNRELEALLLIARGSKELCRKVELVVGEESEFSRRAKQEREVV